MLRDRLQQLQFRGIKIIYQYRFEGRKIKNEDENFLHQELGLLHLAERCRKHMLHMMYDVRNSHPELLDNRDKGIVSRSSSNVNFSLRRNYVLKYM